MLFPKREKEHATSRLVI